MNEIYPELGIFKSKNKIVSALWWRFYIMKTRFINHILISYFCIFFLLLMPTSKIDRYSLSVKSLYRCKLTCMLIFRFIILFWVNHLNFTIWFTCRRNTSVFSIHCCSTANNNNNKAAVLINYANVWLWNAVMSQSHNRTLFLTFKICCMHNNLYKTQRKIWIGLL